MWNKNTTKKVKQHRNGSLTLQFYVYLLILVVVRILLISYLYPAHLTGAPQPLCVASNRIQYISHDTHVQWGLLINKSQTITELGLEAHMEDSGP